MADPTIDESDNGEIATLGPATNQLMATPAARLDLDTYRPLRHSGTPPATNLAQPAAKPLSHLTLMDP